MRVKISFIISCLLFTFSGLLHAQQPASGAGTAKIYLIRHTGYNGTALHFHAFIDSQLVCNVKNNRFSVHEVAPGNHLVNVNIYKKTFKSDEEGITIRAEAGKTYYVKLLPGKAYSFKGPDKLLEVSASTAKPILAKCKEEKTCLE